MWGNLDIHRLSSGLEVLEILSKTITFRQLACEHRVPVADDGLGGCPLRRGFGDMGGLAAVLAITGVAGLAVASGAVVAVVVAEVAV